MESLVESEDLFTEVGPCFRCWQVRRTALVERPGVRGVSLVMPRSGSRLLKRLRKSSAPKAPKAAAACSPHVPLQISTAPLPTCRTCLHHRLRRQRVDAERDGIGENVPV